MAAPRDGIRFSFAKGLKESDVEFFPLASGARLIIDLYILAKEERDPGPTGVDGARIGRRCECFLRDRVEPPGGGDKAGGTLNIAP